jgi:biotin transport system substrate-specific component
LANVVGGILVIYAIGIPVMAYVTGTSPAAAALAGAVFIPGDVIKVVIATTVAAAVHRAVPDLAPSKPRVRAEV